MSCPIQLWAALACVATVAGCTPQPPPDKPQPLGELPSAVTSAQPLWVPFRVRAGKPISPDPRSPLSDVRQLTFDGHAGSARFEPSGEAILYETGSGDGRCDTLMRLDLQTGEQTRLTPSAASLNGPALASQARLLAVASAGEPAACSLWGQQAEPKLSLLPATIVVRPYPQEGASAGSYNIGDNGYNGMPALTPDGRSLVFVSTRNGNPELYATSLGEQAVERITNSSDYDGSPQLAPDGRSLIWQRSPFHHEPVNTAAPNASPSSRTSAPASSASASRRRPPSSASTSAAAASAGPVPFPTAPNPSGPRALGKLVVMLAGPRGQNPRVIAAFGRHSAMPTFAADSRHVLFSSDRDHVGNGPVNYDIYRIDPDGPVTATGHPRLERLTFDASYDGAPAVSPNGKLLLFTSSRNAKPGETNVLVARLDGQ